ncbi:MAG: methionine synthase I (cobalamin-dependent) [Pseudohongiellaceae bacterium]|jgi:methionine synthase I (cobalamin-dependent)
MTATLQTLFPEPGPVLLDGAMGTALRDRGFSRGANTTLANLERPEDVRAIHLAHRTVGAQVLTANTFGALSVAPALRDRALRAGVSLARSVAAERHTSHDGSVRRPALVAGSLAGFSIADDTTALVHATTLLVEAGIDLLVVETCNTVADARAACALKATVGAQLPMVICASSTDGSPADTQRVHDVLNAVRRVADPSIAAGLNCCRGPADILALSLSTSPPISWLKPSLGLGDDLADHAAMAHFAAKARRSGARFLGACCGSTGSTLSSMAQALGHPEHPGSPL